MTSGESCECRKTAAFREQYRKVEHEEDPFWKSCCKCNKKSAQNCAARLIPSWRIMKRYKWRTDLLADMICGLTVGIMQLPQGMAYAMLAEMPPVVGLYMSFFPVLIYFIFGTSRHVSMGTVAVVSLLTGSVIARFYTDGPGITGGPDNSTEWVNGTGDPFEDTDELPLLTVESKIGIAMTLSLLVGITQIIMGSLRLGFVTTYMSDPLVSGFTTATAVHVGTSQIKYIFGLKIPRTDGLFQVIKTYKFIVERITHTNIATLIVSLICIVIIYLVKVQINQRFKAKLRVPIPIELIVFQCSIGALSSDCDPGGNMMSQGGFTTGLVASSKQRPVYGTGYRFINRLTLRTCVIAGTLASYFGKFHEKHHIKVVGDVPAGLPMPSVPSFKGVDRYIADIPIIAIISFAQSVSLASLMAKKHKYAIDSNQELIAYGAGNLFGSIFSCYPFAASVSRSSVLDSAGGKTQVSSLFSASLVLVVILWLGPLFEPLPNCVLSAIIVVALRSLLLQVLELPKIWRTSRFDFFIWVVTCVCATILHVDYGLLIGLFFSFFTVVLRTQRAKPTRLGKVSGENVYKDPKVYVKTSQMSDVKVIGFTSPLYFANADLFVREVYRLSTVKPEKLRKEIRRASKLSESSNRRASMISSSSASEKCYPRYTIESVNSGQVNILSNSVANILTQTIVAMPDKAGSFASLNGQFSDADGNGIPPFVFENPINYIIIDFSAISFIDTVGCKVLRQLIQDYETVNITVYLTEVSDDVWNVFEATEILPAYKDHMYLTLCDAINGARLDKDTKASAPTTNGEDKTKENTSMNTLSLSKILNANQSPSNSATDSHSGFLKMSTQVAYDAERFKMAKAERFLELLNVLSDPNNP